MPNENVRELQDLIQENAQVECADNSVSIMCRPHLVNADKLAELISKAGYSKSSQQSPMKLVETNPYNEGSNFFIQGEKYRAYEQGKRDQLAADQKAGGAKEIFTDEEVKHIQYALKEVYKDEQCVCIDSILKKLSNQ